MSVGLDLRGAPPLVLEPQGNSGHAIHVGIHGRPDGIPAVFLHGGPGSGCQPDQVGLFDLDKFHAFFPDQRGAGRSTPKRSLVDNTTQHLVADLEVIRKAAKAERWLIVGGSWGSTLALAYAQAHPKRVSGLVLRGIFLGTRAEGRWAFEQAPRKFRPELWWQFVDLLPKRERAKALDSYCKRLLHPDPKVHLPAAWAFNTFERTLSVLTPVGLAMPRSLKLADVPSGDPPNSPFVEAHYLRHDFFLKPNQLLDNARRLRGIPGIIVQGRYDLLCPPEAAQALAAAWPDAALRFIEAAGHSGTEPAIRQAIIEAIAEMGRRLA
jgi:proline iminopeptidase